MTDSINRKETANPAASAAPDSDPAIHVPESAPAAPPAAPISASHYRQDLDRKSVGLATILSVMPGLGQVYVGNYQPGFVNAVVAASLITMLSAGLGELTPLAGLFLAFYWLYNMIDAGRRATAYNQALTGQRQSDLAQGLLPGKESSLLGGVSLVVFGTLFLLYNQFGFSFYWIEEWWPLSMVILGAYLIFKFWADQREDASFAS